MEIRIRAVTVFFHVDRRFVEEEKSRFLLDDNRVDKFSRTCVNRAREQRGPADPI